MKNAMLRLAAVCLALTMTAGLTACGNAAASGSSASGSSSASSAASTPEMDVPDPVELDYSKNLDENGFWKDIKALDYVTLPEYKGLDIPAEEVTATEEEITTNRQGLLSEWAAPEQITDRAVEDGDTVNIDYVGSVDGVEFTGGNTNGAGTSVTIGTTQYIDDFLEQLVGHEPGETFNVEVTFPEDYNDSTDAEGNTLVLAGKDAVFVTTINYIAGDTVYPEITDEFVTENLQATYGWATAAEAEQGIVDTIEANKKYNYMMNHLNENATVTEVPQLIEDTLRELEIGRATNQAAQYGVSMDVLMMLSGYGSEADFLAQLDEQLPSAARYSLLRQAIAEQEGMTIEESQLQEDFGDSYDAVVEMYGMNYIKWDAVNRNVNQLLVDSN